MKESIDPGRFARGKSYARKGQVLDISMREGITEAHVQGSAKKTYTVKLRFQTVSDEAKESIHLPFSEKRRFDGETVGVGNAGTDRTNL